MKAIGFQNPPIWFASQVWAMPAIIFVSVWKDFGYYTVIYLAGLQGVPRELYEAAKIDGVKNGKIFLHHVAHACPCYFLLHSYSGFTLI
ncbi:MAG: sugar ABC transporter permease [Cyclobacteriaceae bacterium]|nr:sugar ABC transporter permease [Cyclobacteriaceae bacterium]